MLFITAGTCQELLAFIEPGTSRNDSEYSQQRVCVSLSGIGLTAQFVPVPRRGVHKEEEEGEGEGEGEGAEEEEGEEERQHQ